MDILLSSIAFVLIEIGYRFSIFLLHTYMHKKNIPTWGITNVIFNRTYL